MSTLPSFICTDCGKSLLLESHIKLDSRDRQYCPRCWTKLESVKVTKLGKKYPTGTKISWVNEDIGKAARREGEVVRCSQFRIYVKTKQGNYKWIDEESVMSYEIPKKQQE